MAKLFGELGFADNDRVFTSTTGQAIIYERSQQIVAQFNADRDAAFAAFVQDSPTELHIERVKMVSAGRMQKITDKDRPGLVKAAGYYDLGYPLEMWGDAIGGTEVALAYMSLATFEQHLLQIMADAAGTMRFEILKGILNPTNYTFSDPVYGDLTVRRLANADGTLYPPVVGSESDTSSHTHYVGTAYAYTAITDTNNPIVTVVNHLEEHYGTPSGGSRIAIFIPTTMTSYIRALTDYTDITDMAITPGSQTATVNSLPPELDIPGASWKVIGRTNQKGAWIVEWPYMPENYMVGVHLDAPKPLVKRVDEANTGLMSGLHLAAIKEDWPNKTWYWSDRFGLGARERLSAVAVYVAGTSSYTVPSAYA